MMLQYKVLRTKYASDEYTQNSIEERLNAAAKEGWQVIHMTSASVSVSSVVETYLLSRIFLTDEERAEMEETFRTLKNINDPIQLERNQMVQENFERVYGAEETVEKDTTWITLPDDANLGRWEEVINQMRNALVRYR